MPIAFVGATFALMTGLSIVLFLVWATEGKSASPGAPFFVVAFVAAIAGLWLLAANTAVPFELRTYTTRPIRVAIDGQGWSSYCVVVVDEDTHALEVVDLQRIFGTTSLEDRDVEVRVMARGPYYGLWFPRNTFECRLIVP